MAARFDHGYALLIGVGRLADWEDMSLPESVQDVRAIKETLADPRLCAYPDTEDHIRVIHDEGATRTGILEGLKWLMSRADQDPFATAVVYYSGHGMPDPDSSSYFLIPHDVDPSDIAGTAIAFPDFATEISNVRAQRRLVVLDCCHAGAVRGAKGGRRPGIPSRMEGATVPRSLLDQLKVGKGNAVFCSSEEGESSWVFKGKNISIFTLHFLEAIRGAASKTGETVVNVSQLMNHVGREVPRSARDQWGERQTPFFLFETHDYPVALLGGGKGLPSGGEILRSMASSRELCADFGDYPELARVYLSPWAVFERVKAERFIGRRWLLDRLDEFLRVNDRGLFVLEAEAGLGKTAFLAHLVRERGYVHHFVELAPGANGVARGLESLAAQLIRGWGLTPDAINAAAPGDIVRHDFLQNLLKQAADRRDQERPHEKIVLVVDALDEAGPPEAGQNVMGLPRVLPKGVYLVVSQRPVEVRLETEPRPHSVRIDAQDEKNLTDIRSFLDEAADWPGVRKAREASEQPVSKERFVATLLEKSQGVWIYLKYVLDEIEAARRSPLKLDDLPRGLWQYYEEFWKQWKGMNVRRWHSFDLPFLSTLAAVRDSLTLAQLLTLAGVGDRPNVTRDFRSVLDTRWSPYLASSPRSAGPESPPTYCFYHASLRDFFAGCVDQSTLDHVEGAFVGELAEATRRAHARISDIFIGRWGGLDACLPALSDAAMREEGDHYGLWHLAEHLEGAGRVADLHRLLLLERRSGEKKVEASRRANVRVYWNCLLRLKRRVGAEKTGPVRAENVWFTARERVGQTAGYHNDLTRAARLVQVGDRPEIESGQLKASIGPGIRYALMSASLNSLARNIPPALIATLVEKGIWRPEQGLAHARRVPDRERRVIALIEVSNHFENRAKDDILREAMAMARAIESEWTRVEALVALVPHLGETPLREALETTLESRQGDVSHLLAIIAPHLSEPLLMKALERVRGFRDQYRRNEALALLVPLMGVFGHPEEALKKAREIDDERPRVHALARLGRVEEAWELALTIEGEYRRADALATLAPRLATLGRGEEALAAIGGIGDEQHRARALASTSTHLGESLLARAKEIAQSIDNGWYQAQALAALALRLATCGRVQEALEVTQTITQDGGSADGIAALAPYLNESQLHRAMKTVRETEDEVSASNVKAALVLRQAALGYPREALETARAVQDQGSQALALAAMGHLEEALEKARAITPERRQARVFAKLVVPLAESGRPGLSLAVVEAIHDESLKAEAIGSLGPHLGKDLLIKTLKAARMIVDKASRAKALTALARYSSSSLFQEALEVARVIENEWRRADAIGQLAPYLGRDLLPEALSAARAIKNQYPRARAIEAIAPYLYDVLLPEADEAIRAIENEAAADAARAAMASALARMGLTDKALATARGLPDKELRAGALAAIASRLGETVLREAMKTAKAIDDDVIRSYLLRDMLPNLAALGYSEEALDSTRSIVFEDFRVSAIVAIEPYLGDTLVPKALELARAISRKRDRIKALVALALRLAKVPQSRLLPLWEEILGIAATCSRSDLLADLSALAPVIRTLGGPEAIDETCRAIEDVCRWWP